jgi:uncharacterized protein
MPGLHLAVLDGEFAIHRFAPDAPLPDLGRARFLWIARTDDELTVICDANLPVRSPKSSAPWSCLKVRGPLDLDQVGVLASLTAALAAAGVATMALSTYDTDYLLVRSANLAAAVAALRTAGHSVAARGE